LEPKRIDCWLTLMLSLFILIFLTFVFYCAILWGVFWLVSLENKIARFSGAILAILLTFRHGFGSAQNISTIHREGWDWFYVVTLLMSILFTVLFGIVAWVSVNPPASHDSQNDSMGKSYAPPLQTRPPEEHDDETKSDQCQSCGGYGVVKRKGKSIECPKCQGTGWAAD